MACASECARDPSLQSFPRLRELYGRVSLDASITSKFRTVLLAELVKATLDFADRMSKVEAACETAGVTSVLTHFVSLAKFHARCLAS